jgi:hypothetical protein
MNTRQLLAAARKSAVALRVSCRTTLTYQYFDIGPRQFIFVIHDVLTGSFHFGSHCVNANGNGPSDETPAEGSLDRGQHTGRLRFETGSARRP